MPGSDGAFTAGPDVAADAHVGAALLQDVAQPCGSCGLAVGARDGRHAGALRFVAVKPFDIGPDLHACGLQGLHDGQGG